MKTKAKTHRLLLNTTPEGRLRIQELTLQSGADSESALLRQAFEFYALLHPRLAAGDEAFMRTPDGSRGVGLDISAVWDGPPDCEAPTGIRHRMELKLDPSQREQLDRLVEHGAAPTLTALAGVALEAYGYYLRYRDQGMILNLRSEGGVVSQPKIAGWQEATANAEVAAGAGYHPPQRVSVLEVLRQEAEIDAELLVIDTPFRATERFPELRDQIVRTIKNHHFKENLTRIEFVKADYQGVVEMKKFIEEHLTNTFESFQFSTDQQQRINSILSQLPSDERAVAEADPVWALARPRVISEQLQSDLGQGIVGRLFDPPRWYAKLIDGTYWGYEFVPFKNNTSLSEIYMNPMDPDNVKTRIEMLDQLVKSGWNTNTPPSSVNATASKNQPAKRTKTV